MHLQSPRTLPLFSSNVSKDLNKALCLQMIQFPISSMFLGLLSAQNPHSYVRPSPGEGFRAYMYFFNP